MLPFSIARLAPAALLVAGCSGWGVPGSGCGIVEGPRPLPSQLSESSGVAPSLRTPDVYWTHSDNAGPAVVWAVKGDGSLVGRVALDGVRVSDAEDIASASCESGSCLYLADAGDNYDERDTVFVYRFAEPDAGVTTVRPDRLPIRLPDGARDVEALFVLPGERIFLVSKGREKGISVYRYPGRPRPDSLVTVEEVQRLSERARVLPRQVTAASAAPDGSVVALRTYETVTFYRWDGARLVPLADGTVNLRSLREAQGEGLAVARDGIVALTSEGGPARAAGSITVLRCRVGEPG